AGHCAAGGGDTLESSRSRQAGGVGGASGRWGTAIGVSGSGALGANPGVTSVSCASAGNCAAGGSYTGTFNFVQAFVDSQTNGTWGTAIEGPGAATLNAGGSARATSVSCALAGHCAAGGAHPGRPKP